MHPDAYQFVQRTVQGRNLSGAWVLEFGSYDVNGSVRPLFAACEHYIGMDRRPGPGVDLVGRAQDNQAAPFAYDIVVCCETAEHDPDVPGLIAAARRALVPGGLFIFTAAGPGRKPHGCDGGDVGDEHYANIFPEDLRDWLADWTDVEVTYNPVACDVYAVARRS